MKNKTKPFANSKRHLLCLLLPLMTFVVNAQNYKKIFEENKQFHHFQLADSAYTYNFVVLAKSAGVEPDMEKSYIWYINNTINITQGNYSGKLLHGLYVQYFLNSQQMASKGEYEYGLKVGKWYQWREDGNLIFVVKYEKGKKQGDAFYYDTAGNITEKCRFKNDKKTGKSITYVDGVEQAAVKYKDGAVKEKKKPFWKRILFRKENKQ